MKPLIPILTLLSVLTGCRYDDFDGCDCGTSQTLHPNMDIGEVAALYSGAPSVVNGQVILAGYVTANDMSGNFYRTFIIDDGTGAIEVRAGLYDLKNLFPLGRYVAVKAEGLTVSDYNKVLQIGMTPSGGSSLPEYFGHEVIFDRYVYRGSEVQEATPIRRTIAQLSDQLCGRLITVSGLGLKDGEPGEWASQDSYTSYSKRMFVDAHSGEMAVNTSKYADFAAKAIPSGKMSITGVLMKEKNSSVYSLKMRSLEDVAPE